MKPNKIYIIHYTRLTERYDNIMSFLENTDIPYEFILDYDKEENDEYTTGLFYEQNVDKFNDKIKTLWDAKAHQFRKLNDAEISCSIKHLMAMYKLSQECPEFGLILEDDAILEPDFTTRFIKNLEDTPTDWDAIFFGSGAGKNYIESRLQTGQNINNNIWKVEHPASNCTEAYLLKPDTALKIYNTAIPFHLSTDWELAYQFYILDAKIYWWYPSLVQQGSKNGKYQSAVR